jgi:hypothetical protein
MKYTSKYLIRGGVALIVCLCIGLLVYSQLQHNNDRETSMSDGVQPPPPDESETTRSRAGNVGNRITFKGKKPAEKQSHRHDAHAHSDYVEITPSTPLVLPADLKARLDKIEYYYTNPNYFQEVYEAVSHGQDMETTIKLLKEYNIYTDVVLEHMESYEAFKYVQEYAPVDRKGPAKEYGNRVISEDPKSPEALEAGLYIAVYMTDDPYEEQTYLLGAIKHHPNSSMALFRLGQLLYFDQPEMAIPFLKKANRLDPSMGNYRLGIAYQRLGDYKTAWVHFKKSIDLNLYSRSQLKAIERGEPLVKPLVRDPAEAAVVKGSSVAPMDPSPPHPVAPGAAAPRFSDLPPARAVPMAPPVPEGMSPADIARQDAEHRAFLEMLREQETLAKQFSDPDFREAYFKEVNEFIKWAETIMNETPQKNKNFLAKELERHLSGKKTNFSPDRITRGYQIMEKYGQAAGLKQLQKKDPHLAKEIESMQNQNRNAPKRPKQKK